MRNSKRHSIDKTKCVNTKKTIPFQFFITMKKNLFRKFLALFLTGTLLAGVGCKDYDDDIDKLNDRLDELTTGKIATLESQLGSLQTAVDNLKSADDALGKRIDELKSDAAGDLEQGFHGTVGQQIYHQHQYRNELLAGRGLRAAEGVGSWRSERPAAGWKCIDCTCVGEWKTDTVCGYGGSGV